MPTAHSHRNCEVGWMVLGSCPDNKACFLEINEIINLWFRDNNIARTTAPNKLWLQTCNKHTNMRKPREMTFQSSRFSTWQTRICLRNPFSFQVVTYQRCQAPFASYPEAQGTLCCRLPFSIPGRQAKAFSLNIVCFPKDIILKHGPFFPLLCWWHADQPAC